MAGPSAGATCHQVLSVTAIVDVATWTFDGTISSVDDLAAFVIGGVIPDTLDSLVGSVATFTYPTPDLSGQDWELLAGGLSFGDGQPACPGQTGTVP